MTNSTPGKTTRFTRPDLKAETRRRLLALLSVLALGAVVFWPVSRFPFITYDDQRYILDNPRVRAGLSLESVRWAFGSLEMDNWHPLAWLSHMLDVDLFGTAAGGPHLVNLALHLANAALLLLVLRAMTGSLLPAALAAALFAVHPLHVESVAWVSERKDVLSALFFMLTLAAYLGYARRPGAGRYLLVCGSLALGLTAKPMLVTAPCLLLLLDFWPLGRLRDGRGGAKPLRLAAEKIPLLLLSAASSAVTFIAQQQGGAVQSLLALPFGTRAASALSAYLWYIGKTIWPSRLAIFYPHPGRFLPWIGIGAAVALAAISWGVLKTARSRPWLFTGWFWYLGMLVPVIGLVQVGSQFAADRYTYLPLTGLFIAFAWSAREPMAARGRLPSAAAAALLVVLLALAAVARKQVGIWSDGVTLFTHAVAVTDANWIGYNGLGTALSQLGRQAEAIEAYNQVVRLKPGLPEGWYNLGSAYHRLSRMKEAAAAYVEAIRINPKLVEAHNNLALAQESLGDPGRARASYLEAMRLKPDYAEAWYNYGVLEFKQGRIREAANAFGRAAQLRPYDADTHFNLGWCFSLLGDPEAARREYRTLATLNPELASRLLGVIGRRPGETLNPSDHP